MENGREHDEFTALCLRYLSGEASSEDRRHLVEALRDPAKQAYFTGLEAAWNGLTEESLEAAPTFDADEAYARFAQERLAPSKPRRTHRRWSYAGAPLAALGLAACLLLIATFYLLQGVGGSDAAPVKWVHRQNPLGQTSMLTLADGSRIYLNADSRISFPSDFGNGERLVRLDGEAFFEVSHDPAHPFIVEAGELRTQVLGTRFNVQTYAEMPRHVVTLVEGRVAVTPPRTPQSWSSDPVILQPGTALALDTRTLRSEVETVDVRTVGAWRFNRLIFEDMPLAEVAQALERRFGVDMEIDGETAGSMRIRAEFGEEPLEEILQVLRLTGGLDYQLIQDEHRLEKVILRPRQPAVR
ncbi:MAG: FecR domain-containing protein [Verrucomicrobiota bacterium JB022]|nr:FecR domain-containing protein [Verrucomicrobiota bacterium JB022]